MSQLHLRFSLRQLFLALTLIATLVASVSNYPMVLVVSLILVSPLFFVALMAHLHNAAIEDADRRSREHSSHEADKASKH
jgi:hypothetical protein